MDDETRVALRVLLDEVHKRRDTEMGAAILEGLRRHTGDSSGWPLAPLDEALIGDGDCPECPTGTVESVGRQEGETGHQPYACTAACGFAG